jgi:hypothetical protein
MPGGSSTQFLKANGNVDTNTYLTTTTAGTTYATIANLAAVETKAQNTVSSSTATALHYGTKRCCYLQGQ